VSGGVPIDGAQLKRLRLGRVISRRQLAETAGVGYSTLANVESGFKARLHPETVQRIASALRVKPRTLVDLEKL
jgi:transcriptional regulator with XRE-family HTH domain